MLVFQSPPLSHAAILSQVAGGVAVPGRHGRGGGGRVRCITRRGRGLAGGVCDAQCDERCEGEGGGDGYPEQSVA